MNKDILYRGSRQRFYDKEACRKERRIICVKDIGRRNTNIEVASECTRYKVDEIIEKLKEKLD